MLTNVNDSRVPSRATGAPVLTADQLALWQSFVDGGWALMAQVNSTFGAHGWTTTDLRLLEVLGTREQFGISELASTVHMGVSTVSRQIGRMIDTGDVACVPISTAGIASSGSPTPGATPSSGSRRFVIA